MMKNLRFMVLLSLLFLIPSNFIIDIEAAAAKEGDYFEIKQEENYFIMNKVIINVTTKTNEAFDKVLPKNVAYIAISVSKNKKSFPEEITYQSISLNKFSYSTLVKLSKEKENRFVKVAIFNDQKKEIDAQIEKISFDKNTVEITPDLKEIKDPEIFLPSTTSERVIVNQKHLVEKYKAKYIITVGLTEKEQNVITQLKDGVYYVEKINTKLGNTLNVEPFSIVKREAKSVELNIVILDENLVQIGFVRTSLYR